MAVIFNQSTVETVKDGSGAHRQHLLSAARVPGTATLLDRLTLDPAGTVRLAVPATSVAWLQGLEGAAALASGQGEHELTPSHVAFLPRGFAADLHSPGGATFLYGEIPQVSRLDPGFADTPPRLRIVDWTREPVLDSEHDARKRIYLITPKLFGTKAVKGEMIIYPPGTAAANHHHEGAEHFMYVLRGRGTVYANEQPFSVQAGDVIYYPDRQRHYLEAAKDDELVFGEFFAPAEYRTIWVDENLVCTWHPTGRDIHGRAPAREIKSHSSAAVTGPTDV